MWLPSCRQSLSERLVGEFLKASCMAGYFSSAAIVRGAGLQASVLIFRDDRSFFPICRPLSMVSPGSLSGSWIWFTSARRCTTSFCNLPSGKSRTRTKRLRPWGKGAGGRQGFTMEARRGKEGFSYQATRTSAGVSLCAGRPSLCSRGDIVLRAGDKIVVPVTRLQGSFTQALRIL